MFRVFGKVSLLLLMLVIHGGLSLAAPAKSVLVDKNMQLAMLDIINPRKNNPASRKVKKSPPEVFPSNCLQWNSHQINLKAKPFSKTINRYSREYKVDGNLVKSVILAESCFKTKALSTAGAQGLMQLIPATAKRFGVKNSYNPKQNIRGGVKYLRFLMDRYKNNLNKVIAAYNAGEGRVDQYKGIPPFKETKRYVKNVLKIYALLAPKNRKRIKAVYYPPSLGKKPGRHGWRYNRRLAPHLFKH